MASEPLQSLPYPLASATPDVPADILSLALTVAGKITGRFSTTAARDAAWTAYAATSGGRAPAAGDSAIVGSGSSMLMFMHDGTAWRLWGHRTMGRAIQLAGDTVLTTAYQTLLSITPTMVAGVALVRATGWIANGLSGAVRTGTVQLLRDGATLSPAMIYSLPYDASSAVGQPILIEAEVPAETAGSHTYTLQALASATSAVVVNRCRLSAAQGDPGLV